MTNATQEVTSIDLEQATTVAELKRLWELLGGAPSGGPATMTTIHKAVGGKLFGLCINNLPKSSTIEEIRTIVEALLSLGCANTTNGHELMFKAFGKWTTLCTTKEEAGELAEMHRSVLGV